MLTRYVLPIHDVIIAESLPQPEGDFRIDWQATHGIGAVEIDEHVAGAGRRLGAVPPPRCPGRRVGVGDVEEGAVGLHMPLTWAQDLRQQTQLAGKPWMDKMTALRNGSVNVASECQCQRIVSARRKR